MCRGLVVQRTLTFWLDASVRWAAEEVSTSMEAMSGRRVARSEVPVSGTRPEQTGQPDPCLVRRETGAFQVCCGVTVQRSSTFLFENWESVVARLRSFSSAATSGRRVARSLTPGWMSLPAQTGHPVGFLDAVRL